MRRIAALAIPVFVAEVLSAAVQLFIIAVMGRMGGDAVYLRSLYQPIAYVVLAFGLAFAVTNQVGAAIAKGAGRPGDVLAGTASLARVWLAGGGTLVAVLWVAAPALATLVGAGTDRSAFVWFLRWTCAASMLLGGAELCASSLRGYGWATRATLLAAGTAAVRIVTAAVLGLGVRIGISAIPLAEATAALIGLSAGILLLRRTELWSPSALRAWRPGVLTGLRRIGAPVAASFFIISAYNVAIIAVLARYGETAVTGFSVGSSFLGFVLLPGMVIGTATAILINQSRGAGDVPAIRPVFRSSIALTLGVYGVLAVAAWACAGPLGSLLGGAGSSSAVTSSAATSYIGAVGLSLIVQGPVVMCLTVMEHSGAGPLAIVLNALYFALIVVVAAVTASSADALYQVVAWCNLIGVSVPFFALRHVRRLSAGALVDSQVV